MAGISEGEVAVYDRQLRLWGVQAQQRLLKSKVLIWGIEGTNIEVCKNLVLAGVGLALRDHRPVAQAEVNFNYFLREEDIGKGRAESTSVRVQEMNPLCTVSSSAAGPEEVGDTAMLREALKGYNFVLVSAGVLGWSVERMLAVDACCRELGAGFALTLACGELAFFFSDLGTHAVQEHSSAQGQAAPTEGQSREPETLHFPSFRDWLGCKPADLQKKADASFVLVSLLVAFLGEGQGEAKPEADAKFQEYCRDVAKCVPAVDGFKEAKEAYPLFFLEPLVHVASIVGGLLAQEVIKAITKRDTPLMNSVCFNANTSAAMVELIPAPQSAPKKRKVEEAADVLD